MNEVTTSDLKVGIRRLDVEHTELLKELEVLSGQASMSLVEMRELLGFLADHVSEHFLEEERYMVAEDYPDIEAHRLEHERIALFTSEAQDMLEHNPAKGDLKRTVRSLAALLARHMEDADRAFASYLQAG